MISEINELKEAFDASLGVLRAYDEHTKESLADGFRKNPAMVKKERELLQRKLIKDALGEGAVDFVDAVRSVFGVSNRYAVSVSSRTSRALTKEVVTAAKGLSGVSEVKGDEAPKPPTRTRARRSKYDRGDGGIKR